MPCCPGFLPLSPAPSYHPQYLTTTCPIPYLSLKKICLSHGTKDISVLFFLLFFVMATLTDNDPRHSQPVCQNCTTSTTPLWRRDEIGSVLCNACGLFLKLHGRPRPISLKTDVIKSRNRVKSSGQGQKKKVRRTPILFQKPGNSHSSSSLSSMAVVPRRRDRKPALHHRATVECHRSPLVRPNGRTRLSLVRRHQPSTIPAFHNSTSSTTVH